MVNDLARRKLRNKVAWSYVILGSTVCVIELARWLSTNNIWYLAMFVVLTVCVVGAGLSIFLDRYNTTLSTRLFLSVGPLGIFGIMVTGAPDITLALVIAGQTMMLMLPDNVIDTPKHSSRWLMMLLGIFLLGFGVRVAFRGLDLVDHPANVFIVVVVPAIYLWVLWVLVQRVFGQLRQSLQASEQLQTSLAQNNAALLVSQRAAQEANVAKSRFLANMSHELRTPLNAIIGYSDLMLEEMEDEEEDSPWQDDLAKIQTSGHHLLNIISDILDLAKIESGHVALNAQEIKLAPLMDEVVKVCQPLITKNQNRLTVHNELPETQMMVVDDTKLRQVLLNLLSNAAKFTTDGDITLTVDMPDPHMVQFSVQDTGIGMDEEQLQRIFKPFEQADISTTREYGGTGLGLTLVNELVTLMGGSLSVDSQLGEGSRFDVLLPMDAP